MIVNKADDKRLMIKYKDEPLDSRHVSHFVGNPIADGGRNSTYELIGGEWLRQ